MRGVATMGQERGWCASVERKPEGCLAGIAGERFGERSGLVCVLFAASSGSEDWGEYEGCTPHDMPPRRGERSEFL